MEHKIELIVIDYLQLMSAKEGKGGGNREQEISTISRSIKEIAKELNVPIIALSQLSRSVEQRGGDKRPVLSDLRESGAIEQDADIVGFIYRPDYYGFLEDENGNPNNGIGEIIIAKHRNGATDRVRLRFVQEYARFENIESFDDNPIGSSFKADKNESYTITVPSNFDKVEDSNNDFDLNGMNDVPF
jgi:replicative DNA helicase